MSVAFYRVMPQTTLNLICWSERFLIHKAYPGGESSKEIYVQKLDAVAGQETTQIFQGHVLNFFQNRTDIRHFTEGSNERLIDIPRGAVVISLRQIQETVIWSKDSSFLSLHLRDRILADAARCLGYRFTGLDPTPGFVDRSLSPLLEILQHECEQGMPNGALFMEGMELSIASILVRRQGNRVAGFAKAGLAPLSARRVVDYIEGNLECNITLESLAQIAGLSCSHFSRSFRITFRMTPFEYLLSRRLVTARRYLEDQKRSILEIALATGFANQQHFTRAFVRYFGIPPGRLRRF